MKSSFVYPLAVIVTASPAAVAQTTATTTTTATATATTTTTATTTFPSARFALRIEPAFGVSGGHFYNQLAGARVDARFTDEVALGAYVGYANLKGQEGRAHDVLPALELEYRPKFGTSRAFGLPLRFATGYLPENGPVLRLSLGISYAVTPKFDLVLDAFTPTFWVIRDRTVVSLGAALEASWSP
jgi:hypothetical protein